MGTSENLGIAVLLIGMVLLTTTFIDAYLFLTENISILPVPNLIAAFGEALAPLIEACIRMLYLGVMGWIGSTITIRGITVLLQVKPETKLKTPKKKTKVEAEPKDLEEAWEKALQEAKLEVKSA
ncbi:MAG: hypothetical protein OEX10_01015 [Candidatus Bathyarchaeota archaeon]|nr:hypothetical protein [Candidatus Bathyarchaeota archaeon]